jgi:hypothetical protein
MRANLLLGIILIMDRSINVEKTRGSELNLHGMVAVAKLSSPHSWLWK